MDDGNLIKLKNSKLALLKSLAIDKLKHEREQLNDLYLREKEGIFHFEKEMEELREQEEFLQSSIQEKEESTAEIEQMILESENAYNTLLTNSSKLLQALDTEATNLRAKIKKG